jgi:NodT family efflux transporter outer membrane factor (OMF) lipoprotein
MKQTGCVAWLGVMLALGGCLVGPTYKRPTTTISEAWRAKDASTATQAPVDTQWWKSFGDPVLDRLVEMAYRQNLPLQIAGLRIVEARAQLGVATGRLFPQSQVAYASAAARGISENAIHVPGLDRHFGAYELGFDASWELDFWGKYRRGIESETAGLLGTVADYQNALVSLTAEVARTFVEIRTLESLLDEALENTKVQEESLGIAESRFRNGATSELDQSQATTLLESTRATVPNLQISLQQARNALSTLLGQPPGTVDALLAQSKGALKIPTQVSVSVPTELLRRRPDVRSAELSAAAQCARIGVAKADLFPSFSLLGTVGLQATSNVASASNFFTRKSLFYSAGPTINWPFFNYGRIKNNVRVEDARFQQLLVGYRDAVIRAVQEVEDAMVGFVNAQRALQFEQKALDSARRSATLAVVQYREGAADYQRVLDAQRSLLQQQNSVTQSNSSVATNLIALYKSLGGGWEVREGAPVVPEAMQREMKDRTNWGDELSQPRDPATTPHPPTRQP